jgi:hypothetical protein
MAPLTRLRYLVFHVERSVRVEIRRDLYGQRAVTAWLQDSDEP